MFCQGEEPSGRDICQRFLPLSLADFCCIDWFLIHRCGKYKKSLINAALPFTSFIFCCYSPVTHLLPLNLKFEGHSNPNGITLSRKKSQDLERLEVTKKSPDHNRELIRSDFSPGSI